MATTLGQYKGVDITPGTDAEIQAQMKSIDASAPISVSSLGGNTANPDSFPTATNMSPSYNSAVSGAVASATTPSTDPYKEVRDMVAKMTTTNPTNWTDTYKTLLADTGYKDTQNQVNDLTAQLNNITASSQASQLALEGQDVRRTAGVLDKMQQEIARQNAIKALPVTAALNAAQGRLQSARDNITTLVGLMQKDQDTKLQLEQNKINYALQFANIAQQDTLQKRQEALDKAKTEAANFNSLRQTYIDKALAVGDFATAGKMASATDAKTLTSLAGSISNQNDLDAQLKKAQIAKLQMEINGGGTNPNALLSISDAKTLGVPYGTTVGQAIKMGVTPGQGGAMNPMQLATDKANVDNISSLLNAGGLSSTVGTSFMTRSPSGFWGTVGRVASVVGIPAVVGGAYRSLTGDRQKFIAGVEQVRSQLNLESLINAKAQGATFGALSDQELKVLANSATKLGTWAIHTDPSNPSSPVVGYNASEKDFKDELNKINNFAKLDYLLKGGTPEDVGAQVITNPKTGKQEVWVQDAGGKTYTQLR